MVVLNNVFCAAQDVAIDSRAVSTLPGSISASRSVAAALASE